MHIKFWGVRGSVATPLTSDDVERKVFQALEAYKATGLTQSLDPLEWLEREKSAMRNALLPFTYGGNTACVEVKLGGKRIVLDMGTGLRPLGNSLFKEMFSNGGLDITFLLSHVHWDHIQGLPFFGPLYINKERGIRNAWMFYGGTNWLKTAEVCLQGQMDPPTFPVSWKEIEQITYQMNAESIYDLRHFQIGTVDVVAGKLNHPQETYGYRITDVDEGGKTTIIAYTTDNEPYDPEDPDPRLVELAENADVWITDCQYSEHTYSGKNGGLSRRGWGHSYPRAIAHTAIKAKVKTVVLFHHDPGSSDAHIETIWIETQDLIKRLGGTSRVIAAWEGLEL